MCIDYTNLNKACPKDEYPLPRICQIVDSTTSCELLSFLDVYSGYHQINLAIDNEEKIVFITKGLDKATRGGGNGSQSKIHRGNLAYVPKQIQHTSLLTRSKPHSYWKAIGHRNQDRKPESQRKHKSKAS
jgi:hypothetical protein